MSCTILISVCRILTDSKIERQTANQPTQFSKRISKCQNQTKMAYFDPLGPANRIKCSCQKDLHHPKTGEPFADFQLPHWQEARKLAEHAAMLFLPLRTIGWDLALTDDGPLLLEGNAEWDPVNHLVVHAGPEHQLELADFLNRLRAA